MDELDPLFVAAGGTTYGGRTVKYQWERDYDQPLDLAEHFGLSLLSDEDVEEEEQIAA